MPKLNHEELSIKLKALLEEFGITMHAFAYCKDEGEGNGVSIGILSTASESVDFFKYVKDTLAKMKKG